MPKPVSVVRDMDIDEISLVDKAACPPASVVIAKRADREEGMDEYTDENGDALDLSQYEPGQVFDDDDGRQYQWDGESLYEIESDSAGAAEETADDSADDRELAAVGKSAFFEEPTGGSTTEELISKVRSDLSKAMDAESRDDVVSKALGEMSQRAEQAEQRAARIEKAFDEERNVRLTREYISKAADYNVPVDPAELGPALMHAAEALPYEDCAVIHKALTSAGDMLFQEVGYDGQAGNDDPMAQIDEYLAGQVSKSDGQTREGALTEFFDSNPEAYDALRAERIG